MAYNESDTRAKLIDPAIHGCGWTEDLIRREEDTRSPEEILDLIEAKQRDIAETIARLRAIK